MISSQTKKPWLSKGIVGGAVALLAGLAQVAGYPVTSAETSELGSLVSGLVTSGAGALAIVGRVRARKSIAIRG